MTHPTLQRPSRHETVPELQDLLNRIGALLDLDGDFGQATERAVLEAQRLAGLPVTGVADQQTWDWLTAQPLPSPDLSTADVTFVVKEEVSSRDYYDKTAAFPHFPGEESGVTIGIGYDLRFQGPDNFTADWGNELRVEDLEKLRPCLGRRGSAAAVAKLRSIKVSFPIAWRVFTRSTLPRYVAQTRSAYPQFAELPDGCRGVLVSLVYNRGTGMDGDARREMQAIGAHLAGRDFSRVAGEIEAMKRLWPGSRGLRERRDREAELWRKGLREAGHL
ncbi:MAG: hypothetical protein C4531_06490 [Desulfurivibrio sp.]|nr:MAG: hypothetical protein C4531_06490 [Desulfurivibrio sp.]